jgi:hypothetical protein
MDRLKQAFQLALDDLYEASAAVEICKGFIHKDDRLGAEPIDQQQVWGFIDQAVNWKLALALERLTQNAGTDKASLKGLLREIDTARENGADFADEHRLEDAKAKLAKALEADICKKLRTARNAFMGHSLIGKKRQGVSLYELMEYLETLEGITDALHVGVCGAHLDLDAHIDTWQQWASTWFESMLPDQEKPDA